MKIDDSNREYSESEVRSYIKGLNARIANAEGVIDELKKENADLKEMLKTALSTINHLCFCGSENCELCVYDNNIDECDNSDGFKWVHGDEAKKLIGE